MFSEISIIKDDCNNSYSAIAKIKIIDYLALIEGIDQLESQRDVLRTSTAIKIRNRMVDDIVKGTVIPPLVLGLIFPNGIQELTMENLSDVVNDAHNTLTIIDGIQRTASLKKALSIRNSVGDRTIRVEIWASHNVTSLIYRMLVLNTGQVPWNTRRQVEVLYNPLKKEAEEKVVGLHLMGLAENSRRASAGEYPANVIADLYMAFTSRKALFDNKEGLADDFTRLDVIEASGKLVASNYFFEALSMMVKMDQQFFRCEDDDNNASGKVRAGRDIFTSAPSRIAFIASVAIYVIGRAGSPERTPADQARRMNSLSQKFNNFYQRMVEMNVQELKNFLCLPVLNEIVASLPTKRIGDEERKYYTDVYTLLIKEGFELDTLEEAWRV